MSELFHLNAQNYPYNISREQQNKTKNHKSDSVYLYAPPRDTRIPIKLD